MQISNVQIVLRMALAERSLRVNSVHIPLHTPRHESSGTAQVRGRTATMFGRLFL